MPDLIERMWSDGEVEVLARAVIRAPSVHGSQPWSLNLPERRAELSERTDLGLPEGVLCGRDRLFSCGAALANLILGVRVLGWETDVRVPAGEAPLVAVVSAAGRGAPLDGELHAYTAISRRRSHRLPFASIPVAPSTLESVIGHLPPGVACRVVRAGETGILAALLEKASVTDRDDWGADGLARSGYGDARPPWAGLVRRTIVLPDARTLAHRPPVETIVIFCTEHDDRVRQVRAGAAMQRSWLTAVDRGLAASVLTRPLHEEPVRDRLTAELSLPGIPQLVMRLGYPAGI
ncbi:nitroreductase family protein [Amycolatopsis orientalis]|uniref:nitroreductase family protein n=1 Tax=Amycolatopsis orientalis TaxID=31958 RepID=UPI000402A0AD|nr:nitroreductase family protein [Amycolatopsis orientalis]